jgi:hypothetical protein
VAFICRGKRKDEDSRVPLSLHDVTTEMTIIIIII